MKRDTDIQRTFEVADDSLQGVLGYHLYAIAAQKSADTKKIAIYLPPDSIPITFDWDRYYSRQELIDFFTSSFFELVQTRISTIATVNVYDAALAGFIESLNEKGFRQNCQRGYKGHIKWAYLQSKREESYVGNRKTFERLPETFGIVDNARRIRNLIVHNHSLFDQKYMSDALDSDGIRIDTHPGYHEFIAQSGKPTPVIIATDYLIRFIKAHIEVLHVLHNSIQKRYFGVQKGYDYRLERKPIDWRCIVLGGSKVKVLFKGYQI